jgi:hypothetical protein
MLRLVHTPLRLTSLQSTARQRVRHMANSRFAYVRKYELPDPLLPGTYIVFRVDGHNFHRYVLHEALHQMVGLLFICT